MHSMDVNQSPTSPVGPSFGEQAPEGIVLTTLDNAINWARKNSIWPLGFGLEIGRASCRERV